ncbi:MAG: hypothetical protein Q8S57_06145 [Methanoregula sp.]|nr:hypothetical protein [Methanoregula sp.]
MHTRLPEVLFGMVLILFLYLTESIRTIDLEHKRTAISAVFAEIYLSDTAAGNGKYFLAFTVRAVKHSEQHYMSIRYKN